jgi:hypothetical protein
MYFGNPWRIEGCKVEIADAEGSLFLKKEVEAFL